MVVVSHLFSLLWKNFQGGRCDSYESHRPLLWTIYFPTAPLYKGGGSYEKNQKNRTVSYTARQT